jgi:hypothetical protein
MIGVLGGSGAVGAAAARELMDRGHRVLLGGRDADRLHRAASRLGERAACRAVDIDDEQALAAFCADVDVVVNCAGPAVRILDRVARAAAVAGAGYADAAGDDRLHDLVGAWAGDHPKFTAVVSAGMTPGLSGLLPRMLAGSGFDRARRLVVRHGGSERFTTTAAVDYLDALGTGYGTAGAVWRDGRRAGAPPVGRDPVPAPHFPAPVRLFPYLSTETERAAAALGLSDVEWYTAFAGPRVPRVLAGLGQDAAELVAAAELDVAGRRPFQAFVLELSGEQGGTPVTRTLVARADGASVLTGAMAAAAAAAIAEGACPPGVHHAADVLDPAPTVEHLRATGALTCLIVIPGSADGEEDGEL